MVFEEEEMGEVEEDFEATAAALLVLAPLPPWFNVGKTGKSSMEMNSGSFPEADAPTGVASSITSSTPSKLLWLLLLLGDMRTLLLPEKN